MNFVFVRVVGAKAAFYAPFTIFACHIRENVVIALLWGRYRCALILFQPGNENKAISIAYAIGTWG